MRVKPCLAKEVRHGPGGRGEAAPGLLPTLPGDALCQRLGWIHAVARKVPSSRRIHRFHHEHPAVPGNDGVRRRAPDDPAGVVIRMLLAQRLVQDSASLRVHPPPARRPRTGPLQVERPRACPSDRFRSRRRDRPPLDTVGRLLPRTPGSVRRLGSERPSGCGRFPPRQAWTAHSAAPHGAKQVVPRKGGAAVSREGSPEAVGASVRSSGGLGRARGLHLRRRMPLRPDAVAAIPGRGRPVVRLVAGPAAVAPAACRERRGTTPSGLPTPLVRMGSAPHPQGGEDPRATGPSRIGAARTTAVPVCQANLAAVDTTGRAWGVPTHLRAVLSGSARRSVPRGRIRGQAPAASRRSGPRALPRLTRRPRSAAAWGRPEARGTLRGRPRRRPGRATRACARPP